MHCKKKVREFPVPSRDVTTKLSLGGNNDVITELFLPRGSLVSDIPAGDGKLVNLFLQYSTDEYLFPAGPYYNVRAGRTRLGDREIVVGEMKEEEGGGV